MRSPKDTYAIQIHGDGRAVNFSSANIWALAVVHNSVQITLAGIGDVGLYGSASEERVAGCYARLLYELTRLRDGSAFSHLVIGIHDGGSVTADEETLEQTEPEPAPKKTPDKKRATKRTGKPFTG